MALLDERVHAVVARTGETGAYMMDDYGPGPWRACARVLLVRGLSDEEAVEFLRSKHMRYADDLYGRGHGRPLNSVSLVNYLDHTNGFNGQPLADARVLKYEAQYLMSEAG